MASDQLPLEWTKIEEQATWINPSTVSPQVKHLKIDEKILEILLTNGNFLDFASNNIAHFSPQNWDAFETGYSQAMSELKQHLNSARPSPFLNAPIPASVIAKVAFSLHFLTDAFAAGHMRVPRPALGQDEGVAAENHARHRRPRRPCCKKRLR